MSTEYRRGIPSTAHVEAATRLGLSWHRQSSSDTYVRFAVVGEQVLSRISTVLGLMEEPVVSVWPYEGDFSYRPIRPDGTPVDWEVLDQEVARVGQQGQPATVTSTASAAPTTQPQGFRANLWSRVSRHFSLVFHSHNQISNLTEISSIDDVGIHSSNWQWGWGTADREAPTRQNRADILTRWTVYQELKPLYDLVDGAQGEAAMPRDVINQWWLPARNADRARQPIERCTLIRSDTSPRYPQGRGPTCSWYADGADVLDVGLRNFAAVLDAVAERRVAERMRGQAQAPIVTSAQPEPRRFADVRPDRHGWRWWRQTGRDSTDLGQRFETLDGRCRWRSAHADAWFVPDTANPQMLRYTIIPTDEQGNPVSWGSIGVRLNSPSASPAQAFFSAEPPTPPRPGQFSNNLATPPLTPVPINTSAKPTQTETTPLPRFTADELDDVDHSKTTKLDEVTLRRGKLPTVEQIAKYREVRAGRTGGAVADALKESRIDCEVAQYVLERWAGGLGDADTVLLLRAAVCIVPLKDAPQHSIRAFDPKQGEVDRRSLDFLRTHNATLDTSETPNPTAQRERQEAEERRQRLAELRQRLSAERAAPQEMANESEASRFDLIEPDPKADPAASIRAWEARQAAAKVRPIPAPPRIAKPAAAPRRPAIEVVDTEVDGLSRVDVVTVLVGRAFNGGC